jgi:hypothetical protein
MQAKVNINIGVDTIAALSEMTLYNHVFLMDNSVWNSTGQGTTELATLCQAGQVIHWVVYAIDLQTPVLIKNISFSGADDLCNSTDEIDCCSDHENPDLNYWSGIVPTCMVPGQIYKYKLELQIGNGKNSIMHIDTSSLIRI